MVGAIANFCSPYAYTFWFTVGAPFMVKIGHASMVAVIFFTVVYYFCLIGSKAAVACIVEKSRFFIEKGYRYVMKLLGLILLVFAYVIFVDGISLLI
jgi:threonine/homoserine/homoserine lactone efflux protein